MTRDELRESARSIRLAATGSFTDGVDGFCAHIQREAEQLSSAIGEISADEAWCAWANIVTELLADDVKQYRQNIRADQ